MGTDHQTPFFSCADNPKQQEASFSKRDSGKALRGRDIILKIKREIDTGYFNPISLSDFSAQYYMSSNYLSNLFRQEVGSSFSKYLTSIRIDKSKQYLKYTDFTLEKIADLIGYNDRGYFSRMFKEACGISASEYRKDAMTQAENCSEEYVYIAVFKNDPLMFEQDLYGLSYFSKEYHVRAIIAAPEEIDNELGAHILESVIERRPAGIMVCAHDPIYTPFINEAMDKGIPTVTVDCDAPESKRIAIVSSNWNVIGEVMAAELAKMINYKGKVACLGMPVSTDMKMAYPAFCRAMAEFPDIDVLGEYDDKSKSLFAEQITSGLLAAHPDLSGIAGFDSRSAIGACRTLKKSNLRGVVKVASIDMTSEHISLLRDGYIDMLLGQKRSLFTYYGGLLLYHCNHGSLEISKRLHNGLFINVPHFIDTGFIKLTRDNLDKYIR